MTEILKDVGVGLAFICIIVCFVVAFVWLGSQIHPGFIIVPTMVSVIFLTSLLFGNLLRSIL